MAPTITLTGSFKDLLGNAVTSGTVTAVLMGYGADIPRVAGTAIFDLTQLSASVSGSGTFTLGPFYGNDVITPGPLTTYYQITMPAAQSSGASGGTVTKNYQFSGSGSFDLSQLVPMGTPQRGDNTIANAAIPQVFSPVSHEFLTGLNTLGQLSAAQPAASDLSNGVTGSGSVVLATSPTLTTPIITNGTISAASGTAVSWNSDTSISRDSAGVIDVGNGTAGNSSGTIKADTFIQSAVSPVAKIAGTGVTLGAFSLRWTSTDANGTVDAGISRTNSGEVSVGNGIAGNQTGNLVANKLTAGTHVATAATPTVSAGQVGLGTTAGFGNGSSGTSVTTTAKGTGSGPATAQTITNYLKVNIAGTDYWIPLMQ